MFPKSPNIHTQHKDVYSGSFPNGALASAVTLVKDNCHEQLGWQMETASQTNNSAILLDNRNTI